MKRSFRRLVPALLLVSMLGSSALAQPARVATVDLNKVFSNFWRSKRDRASIEERKADMLKEYNNMVEDWKKARDDYQKALTAANDQAVSAEERERRQKGAHSQEKFVRDAEERIATYERNARTAFDDQFRRMQDNLLAEIRTVIEAKAKAGNYLLVLDASGQSPNGTPLVLYASSESDLTPAVLDQLNASAPPEGPAGKPAEKPGNPKK